jgi:hypothetical protein
MSVSARAAAALNANRQERGVAPQFTPLPISGALQGVDQRIVDMTAQAWGYVVPGGRIEVSTGVSGHSPVNHAPGHALDFRVLRPDGSVVRWDDPEALQAARVGAALGVHGIGGGRGYMGGTHFHWDISRNGPRTWSDSGANQDPVGFGSGPAAQAIAAARGVPVEQVLADLNINAPSQFASQQGATARQASNPLASYRDAIAAVESRGSGDYSAVGPPTRGGDRAYGRYQVMDFNIGPWTEQALGRRMTPQEFLADPQAQDAVFDHVFGGYVQQYGNPQDAASVWFSGRPMAGNTNNDTFIDVPEYINRFNAALGNPSQPATGAPRAPSVPSGSPMDYAMAPTGPSYQNNALAGVMGEQGQQPQMPQRQNFLLDPRQFMLPTQFNIIQSQVV